MAQSRHSPCPAEIRVGYNVVRMNWRVLSSFGINISDVPPLNPSEIRELIPSLLQLPKLPESIEQAIISGIRVTPSTVFISPPPPDDLIGAASRGGTHTAAARALSKHAGRSDYWGVIQGNPSSVHSRAIDILEQILHDYTWWNCYEHFKHDLILEYRVASGHGARWRYPSLDFIGFVEPFVV